uniref:Uncharacterized protein n=1 Tax=Acrobeloides nanus TaxID=290746 RepID=A0A914DJ55_9BILA
MVKILDGMDVFKINLKGIAVGNGLVSDSLLRDTNPLFAYSHGLYDDEEYANLTQECCNGRSDNCKFENSEYCLEQADGITEYLLETFYNYDLYMQCYSEGYTNTMAHVLKKKYFDENIKLAHRQQGKTRYIAKNCNLELPLSSYMNNQETRKALHIPPELPRWDMCNFTLHGQWGDFFDRETAPYYKKIVKSGVRVLLYYGDTDVICQFLSGQKFADTLGLKTMFMTI